MAKDKPPGNKTVKEAEDLELIEEITKRGYEYQGRAFIKKTDYKKHSFEIDQVLLQEFYRIRTDLGLKVKIAATEAIADWVKKHGGKSSR